MEATTANMSTVGILHNPKIHITTPQAEAAILTEMS